MFVPEGNEVLAPGCGAAWCCQTAGDKDYLTFDTNNNLTNEF